MLNLSLLIGAVVLLLAVLAVRLSTRTGLPSLLFYLAIGLLVGEAGGGLRFNDPELTQNLGLIALALILAEGGLTTRWATIRPALGFALLLSTLGVAVSVAVVAAAGHLLLGLDLRTAVLIGAVVSCTDAAAVFSVLRNLPLRGRLTAALEAESGFNDAPVVILVTLVVSDAWAEVDPVRAAGDVLFQLVLGAVIGVAVGRLGQWLLVRSALPAIGLYPIAVLTLAVLSYAAAGTLGASGFIACYLTGLWLGNAALPHRRATLGFAEAAAWLAQIGLFVLLGLQTSPARLPEALLPALVIGGVLLLVARPLSVVVSAVWFRLPWRDQVLLSWAGLRGAVPIVLTTIAAAASFPDADTVFDVVFVLVVVFTLLQAPTLPWLARQLKLTDDDATREVTLDSAPLAELGAEIVQVDIGPRSRLAGLLIRELRLPEGAAVTLVLREGTSLVPDSNTYLRANDRLLVVTTATVRALTEARLRLLSRGGRLARWHEPPH